MRELRLGLVCYGGVSLAIYMHGITVELQRLVRASKAYCDGPPDAPNPFPADATEAVYWDALDAIGRTEDRPGGGRTPLRVVIDVIAGTSAGGINGVVLAKALAHDLDQGPLQKVWFEEAGLLNLLPWRPPLRGRLPRAPLDGELLTRRAHAALSAMNPPRPDAPRRSLMPPGHELDLFVTATDCGGYGRTIDIDDPESILDREHRHVLRFHYDDQERVDHFDAAHDRALALAIRCTSSFPGAFPPVSLDELRRVVGPYRTDDERAAFLELCFAPYLLESGADPERAHFVDGGVLNNRPFDHAVRAILERPARHEVDRRLLFIEPDPHETRPAQAGRPTWGRTVVAALSSIPRHQPIADALLDLARHNQRVADLRHVLAVAGPAVEKLIEEAAGDVDLAPEHARDLAGLDLATLDDWRRAVQRKAATTAGAAFDAYEAIKVNDVVNDLATGLCDLFAYPPGSRHAVLVRKAVRRWAANAGLIADAAAPEAAPAPAGLRLRFLDTYDLNFRRRRLRFLVRHLNGLYGRTSPAERERIDAVKAGFYDLIGDLRRIQRGGWVRPELKSQLGEVFGRERIIALDERGEEGERAERRLRRFLAEREPALREGFAALERAVDEQLAEFSRRQKEGLDWLIRESGLPADALQGLLARYLGFAYWDVFLYPPMAVGDIAELDTIEVVRVSPADTVLLQPPDGDAGWLGRARRLAGAALARFRRPRPGSPPAAGENEATPLKGAALHHFAGFFRRSYRENDFLWGRLDGVERLIAVLSDAGARRGGRPLDPDLAWRGFAAVLAAERPNMTRAASRKVIEGLQGQVDRHLSGRAAGPPGPT